MVTFLASLINTAIKDEEGNKIIIPIEDNNQILTNIKKSLKDTNKVVIIANNPKNYKENDERAKRYFESLELSGLHFSQKVVLDNRNKNVAKDVLNNASLIFLSGGKCLRELKFLRKIKLADFLKNYDGVLFGLSAGSMNLCKIVANFPEEWADIWQRRWLKGLNIFDGIIIPHFDGETQTYQIDTNGFEVVKNYILPASKKHPLIGLTNDSYIMIENGAIKYFGTIYNIENGKVTKMQ